MKIFDLEDIKLTINLINDADNQEQSNYYRFRRIKQIKIEYKIKLHSLYLMYIKLYLHYVKQIITKSEKILDKNLNKKILNETKINKIQLLIDENDNNLKMY